MKHNKRRLNRKILSSNLNEALEELQKLNKKISFNKIPREIEIEISLRHAYHHLNTAWNARRESIEKYKNMTKSNFEKWGRFPNGFDDINTLGE